LVHRSLSPNFTPSAATLLTSTNDVTATNYRDTTAAPSGTFCYAVVANSSKSNEIKGTLPADGPSSISLQPGPGQGKATFMYFFKGSCPAGPPPTRVPGLRFGAPRVAALLAALCRFQLIFGGFRRHQLQQLVTEHLGADYLRCLQRLNQTSQLFITGRPVVCRSV